MTTMEIPSPAPYARAEDEQPATKIEVLAFNFHYGET